MSDQDELSSLKEKINDLESDLGYLQRDFETQNQMIVVDEGRIQKLEHSMHILNSKLDALIAASQSSRTVEDDIPPHY